MLTKVAPLMVGLVLVTSGFYLASREISHLSATDIYRRANSRAYKPKAAQLAAAIRSFDQDQSERSDLHLAKLNLELELQSATSVGMRTAAPSAAGTARLDRFARQIIASAPLSGQAWCRLAELTVKDKGYGPEAERHLRSCYATAPLELWLIERRLHLAMALWPLLSKTLKASATRDIVMIVRQKETLHWPASVLGYAGGAIAPQNAGMIRRIIATYRPALLDRYDGQIRLHQRRAAAAAAVKKR